MKLPEIRALIEAATPGPWQHWVVTTPPQTCSDGEKRQLIHGAAPPHEMRSDQDAPDAVERASRDMAFIAASRTLMPKLLAVAEAAKLLDVENIERFGDGKDDCVCNRCKVHDALAALEADD